MEGIPPSTSASAPASAPASSSGPKACRACATSKTKCVFLPDGVMGSKCRRCNRLNKECVMQAPVSGRKRQPRTSARVNQLEETLDGLVSLLAPSQPVIEYGRPDKMASSLPLMPFIQSLPETPGSSPLGFGSPAQDIQVGSNHKDTAVAHALMCLYRSNMEPQFPFVVIPSNLTAEELAQSKPFLYRVVLMAASFNNKSGQTEMAKEIFQYLSTHMVVENEKSLDLLQGLLVLMAWYHSHVHIARRMSLMLQLAGALVIDLGLTERSATRKADQLIESYIGTFPEDMPPGDQPTIEERRALLGVNFMCSVINTFLRDADKLRFPSDISDECIQILERNTEYDSDQFLVQLVRLQAIADEINQALPRHNRDFSAIPPGPVSLCLSTLQAKLALFRSKLPLSLQQNPYLLMHYHSVLAYLTETALSIPLPTRQATLHACLTSTHAFFSFLFSIQLIDYYKLTYVTWCQLRHILVVLYKLSSFESPDWSPSHVRGVLDLSTVIGNLLSQFEKIQHWTSKSGRGNDGTLFKFIPKLYEYKEAFERRRAIILGELAPPQPNIELAPQIPLEDLMFGQLDDAFWQEIVAEWDLINPGNFVSGTMVQ